MKEYHVKIQGKVQGVFFRQSTKSMADQLGIVGWVKNCTDGTVEALFIGDDFKLQKLLAWIHHGPEQANVEKVQLISEKDCTKLQEGFNILY